MKKITLFLGLIVVSAVAISFTSCGNELMDEVTPLYKDTNKLETQQTVEPVEIVEITLEDGSNVSIVDGEQVVCSGDVLL